MFTTISKNDVACILRTAVNTCAGDDWNRILQDFDEYDDDFRDFCDLIRSQYDISFADESKEYFELLECNTLYEVLEFICKNNTEFKIAEYETK
jgi:TnpA family transposase